MHPLQTQTDKFWIAFFLGLAIMFALIALGSFFASWSKSHTAPAIASSGVKP